MKKLFLIFALFLLPGCSLLQNTPLAPDLSFTEKTTAESSERQTITIKYPSFDKQTGLNEAISNFINKFVKDFKANATSLDGEEKNQLTITYEPLLINEKIVSIDFTVSTYYSGTAHGNWGSAPFNYSLRDRKILELPDLFASPDYLNVLSGHSRRALELQLHDGDKEMLASGTEPKKENYSAFGFKSDRLVFYFAPYQVAPYSAGEQTVEIPYTTITALLTVTPLFERLSLAPATPTQPAPAAATEATTPANSSVKIFFVAMNDNGKSGKLIGCGDSVVGVEQIIDPPESDPLVAALTALFKEKNNYYGESGLYNSLSSSRLRIKKISAVNGAYTIELSGTVSLGGTCDDPRFYSQIMETIGQFPTVKKAEVFINNKKLEDIISGKG
ncbi:MAG: DUF3298 domain-containing protein [Candidatus Magasanikbacteria bacterium]|nr:DUF3298 domain-containing protein [Candidatus Magasanikbacteria bacterium]